MSYLFRMFLTLSERSMKELSAKRCCSESYLQTRMLKTYLNTCCVNVCTQRPKEHIPMNISKLESWKTFQKADCEYSGEIIIM